MNPHDIAETPRTYDDGVHLVCRCGKTFDGPRAREEHETHYRIERDRETALERIEGLRRTLKGEAES